VPDGPKASRWIVPEPFTGHDRQADGVQALLLAAAGLGPEDRSQRRPQCWSLAAWQ